MMKIHDDRQEKKKTFESLFFGNTFYHPTEELYGMKIYCVKDDDETKYNAVDLESGILFFIPTWDEVVPITCSIHIVE